jgi:hypothetical protein
LEELSAQGFRVLGVARRRFDSRVPVGKEDEAGMTLSGFLVLGDPPKQGVAETIGKILNWRAVMAKDPTWEVDLLVDGPVSLRRPFRMRQQKGFRVLGDLMSSL